jgi:hypothetical protein
MGEEWAGIFGAMAMMAAAVAAFCLFRQEICRHRERVDDERRSGRDQP